MKNIFVTILFTSCSFVNERTSEIFALNNSCISKESFDLIWQKYSIDSIILNKDYKKAFIDIRNQPFDSKVIYFNDTKEIVALGTDLHSVRYVYNPRISNKVLDGLNSELSASEKIRLGSRVQRLFMEYQCEAFRKYSEETIEIETRRINSEE